MSAYGDALAAAGLHPDNPDDMYSNLMSFLKDPVKFKNADPNWPGARDAKVWWDDGTGKIALQWPFMGGKWLDAAPIGWNDAKLRAVFKIPTGTDTKGYLTKLYKVTGADAQKVFFLQSHTMTHGGGIDINIDVGKALNDAYNAAVPALAKVSTILVAAAPFLAAVPIVGPGLTATALALGALGPALEKLREQGASPAALAGAAQAALAVAPGGAGTTAQQLVAAAPQFGDVVSQASKIAGAATPTAQQVQQGQNLIHQVIQSTPTLSSVAAQSAPHVIGPNVAAYTAPVPKKNLAFHLGPAAGPTAPPAAAALPAPTAKKSKIPSWATTATGGVVGALAGGPIGLLLGAVFGGGVDFARHTIASKTASTTTVHGETTFAGEHELDVYALDPGFTDEPMSMG